MLSRRAPRRGAVAPLVPAAAAAWGPSVQPYSTPALLLWASRPLVLLHGDPARPGMLGTARCDNQHPISVLRRHLVRVHFIRQLYRPHEPPCRPLAAVHALRREVA